MVLSLVHSIQQPTISLSKDLSRLSLSQPKTDQPVQAAVQKVLPSQTISNLICEYAKQSIYPLKNGPTCIIYAVPAGNPDPKEPCSPQTLTCDVRPRVIRKANEGFSCFYLALETIRDHIGEHPTQELQHEAEIEKLCSEFRNQMAQSQTALPRLIRDREHREILLSWDQKTVTAMIKDWQQTKQKYEREIFQEGVLEEALPHLQTFLKYSQGLNFFKHAKNTSELPVLNLTWDFLKKTGYSTETLFKRMGEKVPEYPKYIKSVLPDDFSHKFGLNDISADKLELNQLPWGFQVNFTRLTSNLVMAALYGFKDASWTPFQPIEALIADLKERGPLVVGGTFRQYIDDAKPTKQKIQEWQIFTWKSARLPNSVNAHSITVVGAHKDTQNKTAVYYVDPEDASDPNSPIKKMYAISYETFCKDIVSLNCSTLRHESFTYALASRRFEKIV